MAKVKNTTESHITVRVEGKSHRIAPGRSKSVSAREGLLLAEYDGLELDDRQAAVRAQRVPDTDGETRHTGGRHPDHQDDRANTPGTPVTETGDTGSTTAAPGVQGVSGAEHEAGKANEVRGTDDEAKAREQHPDATAKGK